MIEEPEVLEIGLIWADIGDLIDAGIDVRFAYNNLDLDKRGGRLTADIQAVIAADYIRNLKEEVRKGIQDRLHPKMEHDHF